MGIIALLVVLAMITYAFIRATIALVRYYKQLSDPDNDASMAYREKHPGWHSYMRLSLPVIITGFCFSALSAAAGFVYVIVRWVSENTGMMPDLF